jgi:transposase
MARAYSNDLRRKLLEAYDRGEGSLRELAVRFAVSHGYTKKIRKQQLRSGQMERVAQRYGEHRRATVEWQGRLREMIRRQPDLTLAEMQQKLYEAHREQWSVSGLWRVIARMGLRLKKSRSTPPSKTRRKRSSAVRPGGNR